MALILTILQILSAVVQYLPQFLTLVQSIIDFIHHIFKTNPKLAYELLVDLNASVIAARHGDPVPLQNLALKVNGLCAEQGQK